MFVIPGGPSSSSFYIALGEQFSIGKKRVCITSLKNEENHTFYPLKMPILPIDMPWEFALYNEKAVEWFLYKGFVPVLIDNDSKVTLIDENSPEQNLHITALSHKVDTITRNLGTFLKYKKQDRLKEPDIQKKEIFQDWYLLLDKLDDFEFRSRIEIVYELVEECKKSLKCGYFGVAQKCLECLCVVTNGSFLFKDCYADLLHFQNDLKAADIYLDISGSKMEEDSLLYLEKAIRSDPTNSRLATAIVRAQCVQARALHCYVTAYLACGRKSKTVAADYLKKIIKLGEGVNNPICKLIEASAKVESVRKKEQRVQAPVQWLAVSESAIASVQPSKSPRLGRSRVSTDRVQEDPEANLAKSQNTITRLNEVSGTILKKQLRQDYTPQVLEKLLWWYIEKEKWGKAEYVAKKLLQGEYKFPVALALAKSWQTQGRLHEAARKYFTLAKTEYSAGNKEEAKECLETLYTLHTNLGAFTPQEKQVLYLLFLDILGPSSLIVKAVKELLPMSGKAELQALKTQVEKKAHFGKWAYFQVDHPDFIASAISITEKILFTKKSAFFTSLVDDTTREYPLDIPECVPDAMALYAGKSICWLLAQGYVPTIINERLTFLDPSSTCLSSLEYFTRHTQYIESKKSFEETGLYAEFLLESKKFEFAIPLLESLVARADSDETRFEYRKKMLYAACACKSELVEEHYKKTLRLMQKMHMSDAQIALFSLHGYLYFQCNPSQDATFMNILFNKAKVDSFQAHSAGVACSDAIHSSILIDYYQELAALYTEPEYVHVSQYFAVKIALEQGTISSRTEESQWQEVFDSLFDFSGAPLAVEVCRHKDPIATYLKLGLESKGKLWMNNTITHNAICSAFSRLGLYYLEHALFYCRQTNDIRALEVYEALYAKMQTQENAKPANFLLCLHAFFFCQNLGLTDAAESFFTRAEEMNAHSLLLSCAKIALLPKSANMQKMAEYNKVMSVCESTEAFDAYRLLERELKGDLVSVTCLEAPVVAECKEVLLQMGRSWQKRMGLKVVDALIEKGLFKHAEQELNGMSRNGLLVPSSVQKRIAFVNLESRKWFITGAAFKHLRNAYIQRSPLRHRAVTRLLDTMQLRTDKEKQEELLQQGSVDEVAHSHFQEAFNYLRVGVKQEAKKCLLSLAEMDPDCTSFSIEEVLMIQLMHKILRTGIDITNIMVRLVQLHL